MPDDADWQVYNELLSEQAERELAGIKPFTRIYLPDQEFTSFCRGWPDEDGYWTVPRGDGWITLRGQRYDRAPEYARKAY